MIALSNFCGASKEEKLRFAFTVFDEDGNGAITKQELVKILKSNHMAGSDNEVLRKAETIMRQTDKDGDGVISFEEFVVVSKRCAAATTARSRPRRPSHHSVAQIPQYSLPAARRNGHRRLAAARPACAPARAGPRPGGEGSATGLYREAWGGVGLEVVSTCHCSRPPLGVSCVSCACMAMEAVPVARIRQVRPPSKRAGSLVGGMFPAEPLRPHASPCLAPAHHSLGEVAWRPWTAVNPPSPLPKARPCSRASTSAGWRAASPTHRATSDSAAPPGHWFRPHIPTANQVYHGHAAKAHGGRIRSAPAKRTPFRRRAGPTERDSPHPPVGAFQTRFGIAGGGAGPDRIESMTGPARQRPRRDGFSVRDALPAAKPWSAPADPVLAAPAAAAPSRPSKQLQLRGPGSPEEQESAGSQHATHLYPPPPQDLASPNKPAGQRSWVRRGIRALERERRARSTAAWRRGATTQLSRPDHRGRGTSSGGSARRTPDQ